ncbi:hypothetical protein LCGC14_0958250 [marine sediment metagenome]|uniref:Uncharacterized protein n=1 Tax=marine sediment metagenome TaxID=412755 RepID=A0A0F9NJU9_9ZZZZ
MKIEKIKCQCDDTGFVPEERQCMYSAEEKIGMNHEPNKCEGWYKIKKYQRGEEVLYLCSSCHILGDIELI